MAMETRICGFCKKLYTPIRGNQNYCSPACADQARNRYMAERMKNRYDMEHENAKSHKPNDGCIYRPFAIICLPSQRNKCGKCGWNPDVERKRIIKARAKYGRNREEN